VEKQNEQQKTWNCEWITNVVHLGLYIDFQSDIFKVQEELEYLLPRLHVVKVWSKENAIRIEGMRTEADRAESFAKGFAWSWNMRSKDVRATFYHSQS